jgi:hypothetical protein
MYSINGVIEKNVQPISLGKINSTYAHLAKYLEKSVLKAGGHMIYYTDHSCWGEVCHLVTPKGYAVYSDYSHWVFEVSRNWLTSVDVVLEFN